MPKQPVQVTSTTKPINRVGVAILAVYLWACSNLLVVTLCKLFLQLGQDDVRRTWWHAAGQVYPYANYANALRVWVTVTALGLGVVVSFAVRATCAWKNSGK